jgi:sodium/proline symporter
MDILQGNSLVLTSFLLYLVMMIGIGVLSSRFSSTGISEFFLGGRKMGSVVVALSAVVSGRSAWLLLGVSGMAFARGLSAVWAVVGYIVVELFMFLFVAPLLRRETGVTDSLTLPDFFESRFKDTSHLLRILSVAIILIFMTAYVSAQFNAGGKALSTSFGITPGWGVVITALIVLAYTILGGFLAVSLTDLIQACFMIIALVLLPIVAIAHFGGFGVMFSHLGGLDAALIDPFSLGIGGLIGFLGIGLGSPGNPHILVRYMSIERPEQLRVSAVVGTVWNVVMAAGALFIGLVGRAFYETKDMLPGADTENLYPFLAGQYLHPVLFGMVIASILAAIMSTADSQLLVAASGVVRDIYQKIIKSDRVIPQPQLVLISRIVIVLMTAVALVLGYVGKDLVFWLVLFAWGGLGASFGPAVILSLFWERTTKWGIAAGMIVGTLTVVVWKLTPVLKSIVYELIPGFLFATIVIIVVSLLTPKTVD